MSINVITSDVKPTDSKSGTSPSETVKQESASAKAADESAETSASEESDTSESSDDQSSIDDDSSEDSEEVADSSEDDVDQEEEKDDEQEGEDKQKPKKKSGFAKRIAKLNSKLSEKDREIEFLRQEVMRSRTQTSDETQERLDAKKQQSPLETVTTEKPHPDDFETNEEYMEAIADWKIEQREAKKEAERKQTEIKTAFQKRVETFQGRCAELADSIEDYADVLESVDDISLTVGLQESLLDSDLGAELIYELSKNRDELERINSLSPIGIAREIGKLEARIQSKKSPTSLSSTEKRTATRAPQPPSPVKRNADKALKKSIYDSNLSQAEFERLMEERERKRMSSFY